MHQTEGSKNRGSPYSWYLFRNIVKKSITYAMFYIAMELRELPDKQWNSREKDRFLKDSTKLEIDEFDPSTFRYEGFDDREQYSEEFVPKLRDPRRIEMELSRFQPPRLSKMNNSPYQALVIRYGILRTLVKQQDYSMEARSLLEAVQEWQSTIVTEFDPESFDDDDDLLHLARAAVDYKGDIDDSELHLIHSYFQLHNESQDRLHNYYTWLDFFKRLSSIDRFPKVSRSDSPEHAIDTIKHGAWCLQEQALIYEVKGPNGEDLVGIPSDYVEQIKDWLNYEMSYENLVHMLESIDPLDHQKRLIDIAETFGAEKAVTNDERRKNIAKAGIYPSELLSEALNASELRDVIDEYGLEADKRSKDDMIDTIIEYFEYSRKWSDSGESEPSVDMYLSSLEDIADGTVERIPPQLQKAVDIDDPEDKLDILFEQATARLFEDAFQLENTNLLGQQSSGTVTDGEIQQDDQWLLWDNKRRSEPCKLNSTTRAKIKDYIDTKNKHHDVEWFLLIAPEFAESAEHNALKLEKQTGVNLRLLTARDLRSLAEFWRERFESNGRELPLSIFYGTGTFDLEPAKEALEEQFA